MVVCGQESGITCCVIDDWYVTVARECTLDTTCGENSNTFAFKSIKLDKPKGLHELRKVDLVGRNQAYLFGAFAEDYYEKVTIEVESVE